jgi:hypothetical protein
MPVYEKLGKYFAANKNIVIAKIDMVQNDIRNLNVETYTTLK